MFEFDVFNDSIESNGGTWELFKEHDSDIYKLRYWLSDGDTPLITLNLSIEEFNDLETLFTNIKKYYGNK